MEKVKLIGIRDDIIYREWKKHVDQIFRSLQLAYTLEEINEVEAIINSGINAIPALVVNNTVLIERSVEENSDFLKNSILKYYSQSPGIFF